MPTALPNWSQDLSFTVIQQGNHGPQSVAKEEEDGGLELSIYTYLTVSHYPHWHYKLNVIYLIHDDCITFNFVFLLVQNV